MKCTVKWCKQPAAHNRKKCDDHLSADRLYRQEKRANEAVAKQESA